MEQVKIIARQRIINPATKQVHNDDGLKALNGYYEAIMKVEDFYNEDLIISQFEEEHQEFKGADIEVIEMQQLSIQKIKQIFKIFLQYL